MGNQLAKSAHNAKLSGVCSGLARYTGLDVTMIRIAFVLAFLFGVGASGIIYFVLSLVMPEG